MSNDKGYMGESVVDVTAVIYIEGSDKCIDCLAAKRLGSQIVHRSKLRNEMTSAPDIDVADTEEKAEDLVCYKAKLRELTDGCIGYHDTWVPGTPRPAQFCNSPETEYQRIEIIAGRIGEFIGLLIPSFMKSK